MNLLEAQRANDPHAESTAMHEFYAPKRKAHLNRRHPGNITAVFFERIAFGGSDCWYWVGNRNHDGYGYFCHADNYGYDENLAHRLSWVLLKGPIPAGVKVLHRCDVRACVNPEHLFLGSQADNVYDMVAKKRHLAFPRAGEANVKAKLTDAQVIEIRRAFAAGETTLSLAERFNIFRSSIYKIVRNKTWKHI